MRDHLDNPYPGRGAFLPERELRSRMRALAATARADGRMALRGARESRPALRALRVMLDRVPGEERCPAAARAAESLGLFEAVAFSASRRGPRCPAVRGEARISRIVRAALDGSAMRLSRERLEIALAAFDETTPLRMEEFAAVPDALRLEVLRAYAVAARDILRIQREQAAAARYAAGRGPLLRREAFLEHALRLLRGQENSRLRADLEEAAAREEGGAEGVVRRAHEEQARLTLLMESLPASLRLADELRAEDLLRLGECAALLRRDEAYAASDEPTRALLRADIAALSRDIGADEAAIVRMSLRLAGEEGGRPAAWYRSTDEGRRLLAARFPGKGRIRRIVPDPRGVRLMGSVAALMAAVLAVFLHFGLRPWAILPGAVCAWTIAGTAVGAIAVRAVPPRPLPRLTLERVPDDLRALVVIPALLTGPERARELVSQLAAMAAGEADPNVEFALLGDFADAAERDMPGDEAILEAARQACEQTPRAHFLQRRREWNAASRRWMGSERKRGALMALNALLLRGENAFDAEGRDAAALAGRFRYVITLDADTRPYPGALRQLIATMAHPLVRGSCAVIQPRMARSARDPQSPFALLMGGEAGASGYGGGVSDLYQDLCGRGGFAGKGIYDLAAFAAATERAFPENAVLSHDLLEGFLAGSAFADDIVLFDGFPGSLLSYYKRLHRWTRGDWQLLPFLRGRTCLQKYRMLDNLRESLADPTALALLTAGMLGGSGAAAALGLLCCASGALYGPLAGENWLRVLARLALLPNSALCRLDAVARAVWRMAVSRRDMLEWVPAADADRQAGRTPRWPRLAAAGLCLAAMPAFGYAPPALLAGLFLAGAPCVEGLRAAPEETLDPRQERYLRALARDTWRFFEQSAAATGFPPDNVQYAPNLGPAARTSPTNIGLYMASCAAARELGLIGGDALRERLSRTAESLERAEKWRGHLYNWYDPETLAPLRPRYVSSVDSGNLAACLLLCAGALRKEASDDPLAARLEGFARGMDLAALYDRGRDLFSIGYDVEKGALSSSRYDLLASEARICSLTAVALGQVPPRHWRRLSRACVRAGGEATLLSWSGTMFEYCMPGLFFRAPRESLLGRAEAGCVAAQRDAAADGLWGVSESGYYAFDARRAYQYRAFGVRALMCRDERTARVISPYASALALAVAPRAAAENLMALEKAGMRGPFGFYEALDLAPERAGAKGRGVVACCMAHHQGMILLACANALTGGAVRACFEDLPVIRAALPLLEEPPARPGHLPRRAPHREDGQRRFPRPLREAREGEAGLYLPDAHLLRGGGSRLLITADGEALWHAAGLRVNRWRGADPLAGDGFFTHIRAEDGSLLSLVAGAKARFAPGSALFRAANGVLEARAVFCLSPEDGALLRRVTLVNRTDRPLRMEMRDIALLSLCGDAEAEEHPAFHALFWRCELPGDGGLRLARGPRGDDRCGARLTYAVSGLRPGETAVYCADRFRLLRRGASPRSAADVFASPFLPGEPGAGLSLAIGARVILELPPRGAREIGLSAVLLRGPEQADPPLPYAETEAFLRAERLAEGQARELLRFFDLPEERYRLFDRAVAAAAYPVAQEIDGDVSRGGHSAQTLWEAGVSGDAPIALVPVRDRRAPVREALLLHAFWHAMGLRADMVFLREEAAGYRQPLRDWLEEAVDEAAPRREGIFLLSREALSASALQALERRAALRFDSMASLESALRRACPIHIAADLFADTPTGGSCAIQDAAQREPDHSDALSSDAPPQNGYGGFAADGSYAIHATAPQAWSIVLAGEQAGALATERGGGFLWMGNSRGGRLTPFGNDAHDEGFGLRLALRMADGCLAGLLPGPSPMPFRAIMRPGEAVYETRLPSLTARVVLFTDRDAPLLGALISLRAEAPVEAELCAGMDWLLGALPADRRAVRLSWREDCLAADGAMHGAACLYLPGARRDGAGVAMPVSLAAGERLETGLAIAWGEDAASAAGLARGASLRERYRRTRASWDDLLSRACLSGVSPAADALLTRWMPYQALAARLLGRAGLFQPGGAYGFRDQLQDALCLLPVDPGLARGQLLMCAAHQFEEGDVQHWWHPPRLGVRTRVSDDLLFLPFVAYHYVRETGDRAILAETAPYLAGQPLPEGRASLLFDARESALREPLHAHCLRALRRAAGRLGAHGLPLMGGGDWNDGMDLVGAQGRGESVWLGEFLLATARGYAQICCDGSERAQLLALGDALRDSLEAHTWAGDRYLRAFRDDGGAIGGEDGRVDLLAQAWAALAGLDEGRSRRAMETAWARLWDGEHRILRLLDPPFHPSDPPTGYIQEYPPGIRENGGQYTHAACWALLALARLGDAERAWTLLDALLPASHADTPEKARRYRAEPYTIAADISACDPTYAGRAGWTWYTGSAGWLYRAALRGLWGYEREGGRARARALLREGMDSLAVTVRAGKAAYRLESRRDARTPLLDGAPLPDGWVRLTDDGREHLAVFPARTI